MSSRTPSYRLHRPSGLAVVTIDGTDYYLGRHGSPESRAEYDRLVAEWLANGRRLPGSTPDLSIDELILAYLRHADGYYRKGGEPTGEAASIRLSLRPLRKLYGTSEARDFGPLALKAVRQSMVDSGLCRNTINKRVARVARMFRWAVEQELIPPSVDHGLRAVGGLKEGRSGARESEPVRPVSDAFVDAVRPRVSAQVWAMIGLQRLAGMRPGEVVVMRAGDLDVSGTVWIYVPEGHKTEHRGRERTIYLGPKARAILKPWLRPDLSEYLFRPSEVRPDRKRGRSLPGERYSPSSYRKAIHRACDAAGVPRWSPNRLRHNAATMLRREFGLDVARVILGHSSPAVTEVYAEVDRRRAIEVMGRIG